MIKINFDLMKENFTKWWKKEKDENPVEAAVGSTMVGTISGVGGTMCVANGIKRLANGENTYAGIGPILTITGGTLMLATSIKSVSEALKLYKKIKPKNNNKVEKEEKSDEN